MNTRSWDVLPRDGSSRRRSTGSRRTRRRRVSRRFVSRSRTGAGRASRSCCRQEATSRWLIANPSPVPDGRISRALGVWLLYTRGFDTQHLFALDEFYEADRQLYYDKIQQARDLDDDLSFWLEYSAEAVVGTLKKTRERIMSLNVTAQAPRMRLTKRQEEVLRFLRDKGRAKAPDIEAAFHLTRARVGQIIKPLVDAGLVIREGQTRATSYRLA